MGTNQSSAIKSGHVYRWVFGWLGAPIRPRDSGSPRNFVSFPVQLSVHPPNYENLEKATPYEKPN
jgi:hypothetical protein